MKLFTLNTRFNKKLLPIPAKYRGFVSEQLRPVHGLLVAKKNVATNDSFIKVLIDAAKRMWRRLVFARNHNTNIHHDKGIARHRGLPTPVRYVRDSR